MLLPPAAATLLAASASSLENQVAAVDSVGERGLILHLNPGKRCGLFRLTGSFQVPWAFEAHGK